MTTVCCLAGAFGQPQQVEVMLGGSVTRSNTVVYLEYFNDYLTEVCVTNGAAVLDAALRSATGQNIVLAHSLGAVVCSYWLANYAPHTGVSPANVRFILLGNSVRPYGGWCLYYRWFRNVTIPTDTPFKVTDFARQYDGWADFVPGAFGSPPAIAPVNYQGIQNAYAGQGSVHPNYVYSSLTNPKNISFGVGNIEYIWEPTFPVPMLGSRNLSGQWVTTGGVPVPESSFTAQDKQLRPLIEKAYKRPVAFP
jgi:pimeloyl-ACP methyl ester carboxylesterase